VIIIFFSKISTAIQARIQTETQAVIAREKNSLQKEYEAKTLSLKSEYDKKLSILDRSKEYYRSLIFDELNRVNLEAISKIQGGIKQSQTIFCQHQIFNDIFASNPRLQSAVTEKMSFQSVPYISAEIKGKSGVYHVTLDDCTCPDYQSRHIPCKHMYRLALQLGLLAGYDGTKELEMIEQRNNTLAELSGKEAAIQKSIKQAEKKRSMIEAGIERIKQDAMGSSWLAVQMADLEYYVDMKTADNMVNKSRPARIAAEEVRNLAKEKRNLNAKVKALEYQLRFYESLEPSLSEESEYTPEEISEAIAEELDDNGSLKYLSQKEYDSFSEAEKWQLALDRWRQRHRSNWQVGRDFERYIGYLYEIDGYRVEYFGALNGKMDLGRDLIVRKGKEVIIIQCKRWSDRKTIHENHVFQLFGSIMGYEIEHPGSHPKGLLITTCPLSDIAIAYADRLNIEHKQNYPADDINSYPLIKCNIGRSGEKIFHLPFDQQYDRVNIDPNHGEFYVATIQEAIDAGFRRAYRWHSE